MPQTARQPRRIILMRAAAVLTVVALALLCAASAPRPRPPAAALLPRWFYAGGRWQFNLPLSNPCSVGLHKMSGAQYVRALGCAH
jgi:hypothetical protein